MLISIVTPSFNQRNFLEQTMQSILNQRGDFELDWIVADGASTDGSVEFLRSVTDPRVKWTSEPDRGQAHALQKAIDRADGEVIGWLNSDDLYAPDALAAVMQAFEDPDVKWVIGRCENIDASGKIIRSWIARYKDRLLGRYSYPLLLRENFISQPAVFWRNGFAQEVGGIDDSLHHAMDYDLWLRMAAAAQPVVLRQVLAQFRIHPTSKTGLFDRERFEEGYRVAQRYFGEDGFSRFIHRLNVEKIVWTYRLMRLFKPRHAL